MMYTMNQQIQTIQKERVLDKARIIATSKRVRRSQANRNIWLVGSGNVKTPNRFYCVMWNEDLEGFTCDCKAFEFSSDNTCKHILAAGYYEKEQEKRQPLNKVSMRNFDVENISGRAIKASAQKRVNVGGLVQ